jgi:hypothetical protein
MKQRIYLLKILMILNHTMENPLLHERIPFVYIIIYKTKLYDGFMVNSTILFGKNLNFEE